MLSVEETLRHLRQAKLGDNSSKEILIQNNSLLVKSIVFRFKNKGVDYDDLYQLGCMGLLKAIYNFDESFGVRFSTYAVPMIIGEIRRYMRDNNSMRISRSMRDLAYRALGVKEHILATKQRDATLSEIATALGESESAVGAAMEAIVEPVSLYDSVWNDGGEDSMYVIDKLAGEENSDETWVESITLKEALKKLSAREASVIARRFYKGRTQMEIADEIGISQAQVSRIEKGAIDKLRRYMK